MGIGVDYMLKARLEDFNTPGSRAFYVKTFTTGEHKEAMLRDDPQTYYAGRFAAKEAIFKALNMSSDDARLNEIEIIANTYGQPQVYLRDWTKTYANKQGIQDVLISITHETDTVVAFAVARGNS